MLCQLWNGTCTSTGLPFTWCQQIIDQDQETFIWNLSICQKQNCWQVLGSSLYVQISKINLNGAESELLPMPLKRKMGWSNTTIHQRTAKWMQEWELNASNWWNIIVALNQQGNQAGRCSLGWPSLPLPAGYKSALAKPCGHLPQLHTSASNKEAKTKH